ncbi:MAG: hypothetical protein Kow0092_38200 [Deferrisomatales bacterium]
MSDKISRERRGFLTGALAGLGALGLFGPRKARGAPPARATTRDARYRRTPQVDAYYRTLRD